jgi:UDP-N-acetyl-D-glucosamine/UDP-N-acetyl-D-galactosamine dehydrogenase
MGGMETKICIVGLGYVGLPLAIEFAKQFDTIGFDINEKRIQELKNNLDRTNEISEETLKDSNLKLTTNELEISNYDFIIVAVPTPIDEAKKPNLDYLKNASKLIGRNLSKGSTIVYESTVYPGVTEEICTPLLEQESGLKVKQDFKVGYSPERINPGDKEHTIDKIIKIVSGIDEESLNTISKVYSQIITAGVFKAKDIKTAEAAKVIENIQRDLNIALVNELSLIFDKLNINTKEVLEAAGTKWNFHKYTPGLVGGHCIGIDPYYLAYKAEQLNFRPKLILAGRNTNEYMPKHLANLVISSLNDAGKVLKGSKVLLLGLAFKENINDTRNSKALDLITHLKEFHIDVIAHDPLVNADQNKIFEIENKKFEEIEKIDATILVTPHDKFKEITLEKLKQKMDHPILIDIKSFYDKEKAKELNFIYKSL